MLHGSINRIKQVLLSRAKQLYKSRNISDVSNIQCLWKFSNELTEVINLSSLLYLNKMPLFLLYNLTLACTGELPQLLPVVKKVRIIHKEVDMILTLLFRSPLETWWALLLESTCKISSISSQSMNFLCPSVLRWFNILHMRSDSV